MQQTRLEFSPLLPEHESVITEYVSEFAAAGENTIHGYFGKTEWNHQETVKRLNAWPRGEGLENNWVPNTTRFLIRNGRILGNYNFRHELTEALSLCGGHCGYSVRPSERRKGYGTLLLRHAKSIGQSLGLEKILVTCSVSNVGSTNVIVNNGGVLENIVIEEATNEPLARYWIIL